MTPTSAEDLLAVESGRSNWRPRLDAKVRADEQYNKVKEELPPQPIDTLQIVWLFHHMLGEEDMKTDATMQEYREEKQHALYILYTCSGEVFHSILSRLLTIHPEVLL